MTADRGVIDANMRDPFDRRLIALDMANFRARGDGAGEIVAAARVFESYLAGDDARVADALTPDGGSAEPDDTADGEPWEPQVGDRVTVHFTEHAGTILPGSAGTVTQSFTTLRRAVVTLDPGVASLTASEGWHASYAELRPLDDAVHYLDPDGPAPDDDQPPSVGPERLPYAIAKAYREWIDDPADVRGYEFAIAEAVQRRLGQYDFGTPMSQIYTDWFGGGAS